MVNRATESIKKGIKKGENIFFMYGDYIHDWFLYDLYNGVKNAADTYKSFFLKEAGCNYCAYVKNSNTEVYELTKDGEIAAIENFTRGKIADDDILGDMSVSNIENNEDDQGRRAANEAASMDSDENRFIKILTDRCKNEPKKKFGIIFEDFEWTAGLYKSSNDNELGIIERLKELSGLKNTLIVVTIEEIQMLKRYNFNIDGKNVIMVGSPSGEEIYYTYFRRYIKSVDDNIPLNHNLFIQLREISEAVASGEKSLIDSLRILDRVLAENEGRLEKSFFETALDKHIEEKVSLDEVVLDKGIKERIVTAIDEFLGGENSESSAKGIILTGPPGTGKTFLTKALANEKNCFFMSPSLADLKGEYVGQTSPKVKKLFQQARANSPTVIFIDEADTVFGSRSGGGDDTDSFTKDMVNQFLVEIDGLQTGESKVFVIAATNRIEVLDSAIRSRLGEPIAIPLPDKKQRRELFTLGLKKKNMNFNRFGFTDEFLNKTNRMSGRDIKNFIGELDTLAKIQTKNISDFKDEEETRELFYAALLRFEDALVMDLSRELNVEIIRPDENSKNRPDYDSIIGFENIKTLINRQVSFFKVAERNRAEKFGIKPKKGILLYGPPGNGKSQLALAAANEHNLYFMKITSETLTKAFLDRQNQIISRIFSSALQLSELCCRQNGVLLFFDEFDSLVSTSILDPRVRGTILTKLDDKETLRNPKTKILFMAATNFIGSLDEAVIRAGRIDDKAEMSSPDEENGSKMIKQFLKLNGNVEMPEDQPEDKPEDKSEDKPEDEIFKMAYSRYKKKYQSNLKNNYIKANEVQWFLAGREKKELEKIADTLFKDSRPSGADLRNFSELLIETAYNRNNLNESKTKLKIDEDVINAVCEEYKR